MEKEDLPEQKESKESEELSLQERYDNLFNNYAKVCSAFNKAITLISNQYAEKLTAALFEEVEKERNK